MASHQKNKRLTAFLRKLLTKSWTEFVEMEADHSHSSQEGVVFVLVRSCQQGKLPAIKESLDRIDGKVAQQIEVQYPKFFFRFPYAKSAMELPPGAEAPSQEDEEEFDDPVEEDNAKIDSLRHALNRMSEQPKQLVKMILDAAQEIDVAYTYKGEKPGQDPLVKAVMIAGLLDAAHKGDMASVFEVLDQLDGKVNDTVKVVGEDVYINRYDLIAPAGAVKNKDGIYELVADNTTSSWVTMLERENSNERRFGK